MQAGQASSGQPLLEQVLRRQQHPRCRPMKVRLWVRQGYRPQRVPGNRVPALQVPSLQRVRALPPPQRQPGVGPASGSGSSEATGSASGSAASWQRLLQHLLRPEEFVCGIIGWRARGGARRGALTEDRRADQMGGRLEDRRVARRADQKGDLCSEALMEGHWAGRIGGPEGGR